MQRLLHFDLVKNVLTLVTLAVLQDVNHWGGGADPAPLLLREMNGLTKKLSIFSMGNLEQILISAYPSKNYSKYPKSTLEHKWFLSKLLFCRSSVLRNLRFLA